jgi:hypothetical protein
MGKWDKEGLMAREVQELHKKEMAKLASKFENY